MEADAEGARPRPARTGEWGRFRGGPRAGRDPISFSLAATLPPVERWFSTSRARSHSGAEQIHELVHFPDWFRSECPLLARAI